MAYLRFCVLVMFVAAAGCGGGLESTKLESPAQPGVSMVKSALESVAETGVLGSEMMSVQQGLEDMKSTDAEKAEKVSAAVGELSAATSAEARKAKAREILGML